MYFGPCFCGLFGAWNLASTCDFFVIRQCTAVDFNQLISISPFLQSGFVLLFKLQMWKKIPSCYYLLTSSMIAIPSKLLFTAVYIELDFAQSSTKSLNSIINES